MLGGLFGALVDGDGGAGHFEEDAGFLLLELHFAEHGSGLGEVLDRLVVGMLREGDLNRSFRCMVGEFGYLWE